jgi:CDP-paratose 2-epimerase
MSCNRREIMNILVTGGCGFVGSNVVEYFLSRGHEVYIIDDLSRPGEGAWRNFQALTSKHPDVLFAQEDVLNIDVFEPYPVDLIIHLAAQTAMTTSLEEPEADFLTNAYGTFKVLEFAREKKAMVLYTSTNKVYGHLSWMPLEESEKRWDFLDLKAKRVGISESCPLDFEGPYGCSKGTGDQYCLTYANTYGVPAVVFRMSGIYGPSQWATEDQGWVTWIVKQCMEGKPINIFGDGKQVRDILYIDDLLRAMDLAIQRIDLTKGQAFNIGGGRDNSISILELLNLMKEWGYAPSEITYGPWRSADQKVYITDFGKARRFFNWEPQVSAREGIGRLVEWLKSLSS